MTNAEVALLSLAVDLDGSVADLTVVDAVGVIVIDTGPTFSLRAIVGVAESSCVLLGSEGVVVEDSIEEACASGLPVPHAASVRHIAIIVSAMIFRRSGTLIVLINVNKPASRDCRRTAIILHFR